MFCTLLYRLDKTTTNAEKTDPNSLQTWNRVNCEHAMGIILINLRTCILVSSQIFSPKRQMHGTLLSSKFFTVLCDFQMRNLCEVYGELLGKVWSGCYLACDTSQLYKVVNSKFRSQLPPLTQVCTVLSIFKYTPDILWWDMIIFKYPPLFTYTSANNCFSIYNTSLIAIPK